MHYIGTDIIEIARIEKAIVRWGDRFLHRIYTGAELELCCRRVPSLAVRFAGKEAVIKALGTGTTGIGWRDIEILSGPGGRPFVRLYGRAQEQAGVLGLAGFAISLSHSREYALAFVAAEAK